MLQNYWTQTNLLLISDVYLHQATTCSVDELSQVKLSFKQWYFSTWRTKESKNLKQGSYTFSGQKFKDFSRTFQDPTLKFQGLFFNKNLPQTNQRTCARVTRENRERKQVFLRILWAFQGYYTLFTWTFVFTGQAFIYIKTLKY